MITTTHLWRKVVHHAGRQARTLHYLQLYMVTSATSSDNIILRFSSICDHFSRIQNRYLKNTYCYKFHHLRMILVKQLQKSDPTNDSLSSADVRGADYDTSVIVGIAHVCIRRKSVTRQGQAGKGNVPLSKPVVPSLT